MSYEYKVKGLSPVKCSSCRTISNVMLVEKISIAHADDNEVIPLCGDCLQNEEDYQKERCE
jgi:hypothetical protein